MALIHGPFLAKAHALKIVLEGYAENEKPLYS